MRRTTISSLQNPRIKQAMHLRDRRSREQQGRFLIDGARELLRAIQAGLAIDELFVCESRCVTDECRQVLSQLPQLTAEIIDVAPAVFEKLAYGDRAEGVLAAARTPHSTLANLVLPANPLIAVLEGIEKPGNLGAVLRSADAAGVSAVVVADGVTDLYNPNVIRASLGTIFSLPVFTANSAETQIWLSQHEICTIVAQVNAKRLYTEVDLRGPVAIVLGSEAKGLSAAWKVDDVTAVKLPMLGVADSLNVSAAASVLFYEALRQRMTGIDAKPQAAFDGADAAG